MDLNSIYNDALDDLKNIKNKGDLPLIKSKYIGRKGKVTELFKELTSLPKEERKDFGQKINEVQNKLKELFEEHEEKFRLNAFNIKLNDITRDAYPIESGRTHILNQTYEDIYNVFKSMGFTVVEGPEIEDEFHNFEALNFPKSHPARDTQDSFFFDDKSLLRTHTSPVQIRIMESWEPPFAVISPGKCYRRDTIDASHSFMFNQIEGFLVDEDIGVGHLKAILDIFVQKIFGEDVKFRLRPHFFPFTEPSMEIDIGCIFCGGKGCNVCKNTGWIEIMGAGIIDPNVFTLSGIDPEKHSGFAFGMGVERIAMLRQNINDMRLIYGNDLEFLKQFRG
ncbi:phenylalanine--tRNA ligase subunit alpha [bacterium]|nr:phenylalanine--tRNA ligase subunit alpha [bacterium]